MQPNAFPHLSNRPGEDDLVQALGPSKALWDRLISDLKQEHELDGEEWKSYSAKSGWSLRLLRGKRNILYLAPCPGSFRVTLVLGDRAMTAVRNSSTPQKIRKIIAEAPKYPEGTGIRIDRVGPRDIPAIKKLVRIKLEN
jgi:hypothetical protein